MLAQREDRMFLLWSVIWLVWAMSFISVAMLGYPYGSAVLGVVSFLLTWFKFCDDLHIKNQ